MSAEFSALLPLIIGGAIAALIALLVVLRMNRRARVITDDSAGRAKDILDDGAAPAQRNQALIDSPPAVTPIPASAPAPAAVPAPAPATADDLTRIKGLGPKLAALLGEQGITTFAQIAAWDANDVARIDASLGRFAGRITRDHWVEQAKLLETGDESGFAEKFGQIT